MSTVRDAVLLAAETLEEHPERWMQGDLFDDGERCACALGMCYAAADILGVDRMRAYMVISGAYCDLYDDDLPSFNDDEGRTAAEVAARLRELAERL